jgi:signal transduction histidine kinase
MATLINTLLDVGRLATGHMELEKVELDLRELIEELAHRFEDELAESGCTLALRLNGPAIGKWDRLRIEQLLSNLIANALKFGRGKPIEVDCTTDQEGVHVQVRDHGVGIAPEDQERIFRRFERAVSTRQYGGLGLGLWIANDIVKLHDGTIHVESKLGEGSTFTVDFPRLAGGKR